MRGTEGCLWKVLGVAVALGWTSSAVCAGQVIDFNRDVRPILADACFSCHGPDAKTRKAELRLDIRAEALKETPSGVNPIVPGAPEESDVIDRLFAEEPDRVMPPPKANKALRPEQKEILKRWIAEGAEYQAHWSFVPPRRSEPPQVKHESAVRNPVDRFVLQRLEREGREPAPEADRTTRIRRVTLDLTGLPPTTEEVNAFLTDTRPDAYERLVDRLLDSPRFGERMALWWLDGARYADSNGYQADYERSMWRWRDWVIDAFNTNKPFDEFTIEQLAGDLLPDATTEQRLATGFNRNHRINTEGGIIAEEWRVETVIDRVETTFSVWMGLTMGCARCHDHKYDPFTQKEFYQLFAFFNNVAESGVGAERPVNHPPLLQAPRPVELVRLRELEAAVTDAERSAAAQDHLLPALVAAWERETLPRLLEQRQQWPLLDPTRVESAGGAKLERQPDNSYLASGKNPGRDVYTIEALVPVGRITALRLEAMIDRSLPQQSLGRFSNGNFVLSGIEAELREQGRDKPTPITFARAVADFSQSGWPIEAVLAGKAGTGWAVEGNNPERRVDRQALFMPEQPVDVPPGATLTVRLRCEALNGHNIGRFRLSTTSQAEPALPRELLPGAVAQALFRDPYQRTPEQKIALAEHVKAHAGGPLAETARALTAARKAHADSQAALPTVMVMEDLPSDKQRDCFVLIRGQYDKRGEKVAARLPDALPPLPEGAPTNRLGLARWMVDPSNPLTPRVQVNRLWELLFGVGLVRSSENLGTQGEWPSHPELLDWLASEFVQSGWNVKSLLRTIVTSATYRQESRAQPQEIANDPENRLLARGPRFRLQAEVIRDQALAISGLLVDRVGGPSVRPYQPQGVWDETNVYGNLRNYKHDKDDGLYRRSLYTIWKRTAAPPSMLLFDAPGREVCTVKRARTNTPLQALTLLNEVTYVEAARVLAELMLKEGGATPTERIAFAWRRTLARQPSAAEIAVMTSGLERRWSRFREAPEAAQQFLSVGERRPDPALDPAELAAYTMTSSVILNLDETVTKD